MSKAAEAFRTISEIADELDVPKHVLRFWELKFPQLKPMKRGGGRRYYRPEDVALLRGIRHLLHADGYTIKGVQKILREQGVEAAKAAGQTANDHVTPAAATKKRATARSTSRTQSASPKATVRPRAATSAKNVEKISAALENAINELRVCRDLLREKTATATQTKPRKAAAKPARKRARARAAR